MIPLTGVVPQILVRPRELTHVQTGVTFVLSCVALGEPTPGVQCICIIAHTYTLPTDHLIQDEIPPVQCICTVYLYYINDFTYRCGTTDLGAAS